MIAYMLHRKKYILKRIMKIKNKKLVLISAMVTIGVISGCGRDSRSQTMVVFDA